VESTAFWTVPTLNQQALRMPSSQCGTRGIPTSASHEWHAARRPLQLTANRRPAAYKSRSVSIVQPPSNSSRSESSRVFHDKESLAEVEAVCLGQIHGSHGVQLQHREEGSGVRRVPPPHLRCLMLQLQARLSQYRVDHRPENVDRRERRHELGCADDDCCREGAAPARSRGCGVLRGEEVQPRRPGPSAPLITSFLHG
jgi:hypothetical protein